MTSDSFVPASSFLTKKAYHTAYAKAWQHAHPRSPLLMKAYNLRSKYNLSLADYNQMFQNQNGLCLGCYRHQSEIKVPLGVDHCHKTKKIRGLLCARCNSVLGYIFENSATLRRLADYLDR